MKLEHSDNRRWFNGTFGNLSVSPTFSAKVDNAVNDVIVIHPAVEQNIKVIGITIQSSALGTSSKLTFSLGNTTITSDIDTSAAMNSYLPVHDYVTKEGDKFTAKVTGGAVSGNFWVKLHYEVLGNL